MFSFSFIKMISRATFASVVIYNCQVSSGLVFVERDFNESRNDLHRICDQAFKTFPEISSPDEFFDRYTGALNL
jgi:hypothetical protein